MQPDLFIQMAMGIAYLRTWLPSLYARFQAGEVFGRFGTSALSWRRVGVGSLLLLGLSLGLYGAVRSAAPMPNQEPEPVLCISAVQGREGAPQVVFQGAETSLAEAMANQGLEQLVQNGFTVTHQACFASWQAGADFVTDGEVQLPSEATEADFVRALMKWKMQRQTAR